MHQVLFRIPVPGWPDGIPVQGFGLMLLLGFLSASWLATRLARREGIAEGMVQDIGLWLFLGGLAGARALYMWENTRGFTDFVTRYFRFNEGGIILYGGYAGGALALVLGWYLKYRSQPVSPWRLADVYAAPLALGVALGRVGCLLNGCCYGQPVPDNYGTIPIHFPLPSAARFDLSVRGLQSPAGFTLDTRELPRAVVGAVEPGSGAEVLKPGDRIVEAAGMPVVTVEDISRILLEELADPAHRGTNTLQLKVVRDGEILDLSYAPRTIGLHPAQLYETMSMILLTLLIVAYLPLRGREGQAAALFVACYGAHRFLNELLRSDPRPVGLENNTSVMLVIAGILMWLGLQFLTLPIRRQTQGKDEESATTTPALN